MATKKKVVKKKATYKTEKVKNDKFEETSGEVEQLDAGLMKADEMHRVGTSMSLTRNLGDYQSAKFTVWIDYPTTEKDIEKTFKNARSFCEIKVQEFSEEVDADLRGE